MISIIIIYINWRCVGGFRMDEAFSSFLHPPTIIAPISVPNHSLQSFVVYYYLFFPVYIYSAVLLYCHRNHSNIYSEFWSILQSDLHSVFGCFLKTE
jgi:hypothetical protein